MATREANYGVRIAPGIKHIVDGLWLQGNAPPQIHELLRGLARAALVEQDKIPSVRTIQRMTRDSRAPQESQEEPPQHSRDELRLALDAVAELVMTSGGAVPWPSPVTIAWMAHLTRLAPAIPSRGLWLLALAYRNRRVNGRETGDLDAWLAFKPWESEVRYGDYLHASQEAWIPRLPWFDPVRLDEFDRIWDPLLGEYHSSDANEDVSGDREPGENEDAP